MDYKLKALHKQYEKYIKDHKVNIWITAITAFIMLAFAIIAVIFELSIWFITVIMILFAVFITSLVVLSFGNEGVKDYIPIEVRKAEKEYQEQRTKEEKELLDEVLRADMEAEERKKKINYLCDNFDLFQRLIHKEEKEWQKEHSALDKKPNKRKPKFFIGMTVYEKKYGKLFTYTIHKISDLGEQGFIYTCIKHTCFITREERQFMEDEIEKTEEILSNNKLDGKKK